MKNIIIILFLTTTLLSCDYFNNTRVCNQTRKEIKLKISFDSEVIKTWSGGMFVENLTKTFQGWGENLIPIVCYTQVDKGLPGYLINARKFCRIMIPNSL